jgi:hypothetical protein
MSWSKSGAGIGQDSNNQLYKIEKYNIKRLSPPKPIASSTNVSSAISDDGTAYASIDSDIYLIGSGGGFTKIHTTNSFTPILVGSNNAVAVISPPRNDSDTNMESGSETPIIEIVGSSGKITAKQNIKGMGGAWSPDGSKLLVTNYFGNSGIYDKNLDLLATLPNYRIDQVYWVDDKNIIYSVENTVWSYGTTTSQSHVLAQLGQGNTIKSIAVGNSKDHVYLASTSSDKYNLYRFGLRGQSVPGYITTLDVFLPVNLDSCNLSYVNFTKPPTIVMTAYPDDKSICQTQTDIELIQDGLGPNNFRYFFEAIKAD